MLDDLGLETFREEKGWFGLGWYYVRNPSSIPRSGIDKNLYPQNLTEVQNYESLAKERLELQLCRRQRQHTFMGHFLAWLGFEAQ